MGKNLSKGFLNSLAKLNGQECWSVIGGEGTGSNLTMGFGQRIERTRPLDNPFLTPQDRHFVGEYSLFITCMWRLDSKSKVICGSYEPNDNDGYMIQQINKLAGLKVISAKAFPPGYDLEISFEKGLTFRAFCLETDPEDKGGNFCLFIENYCYSIETRSEIKYEEYKKKAGRNVEGRGEQE